MDDGPSEITALLKVWVSGDAAALELLTPLVYGQLQRMAGACMRHERSGHTLQTTALVHEAYVKLVNAEAVEWQDRAHFFAIAARIMRRILVDHARKRSSVKRGGRGMDVRAVTNAALDELPAAETLRATELCALDDALTSLAQLDRRRAQVVELRFFGGLTVEETAEVMQISTQTVMRDWKVARAWLTRELHGS